MQDPFAVWSVRSVGSGNKYLYDHPTGDKEVGGVSETGFAGLATSTGMMHKNGNLILHIRVVGFSKKNKDCRASGSCRIAKTMPSQGAGRTSMKLHGECNPARMVFMLFFVVNVCIASRVRSRSFDHASRLRILALAFRSSLAWCCDPSICMNDLVGFREMSQALSGFTMNEWYLAPSSLGDDHTRDVSQKGKLQSEPEIDRFIIVKTYMLSGTESIHRTSVFSIRASL